MAILTIHKGKNQGKTFEIIPPIQFGRDKEADITISDPRVSREHGRITVENGKFFIEDLDSSNGTHVNGIATQRSEIVNGDLIQVGDTELLFQVEHDTSQDYATDQVDSKEADQSSEEADQSSEEKEQTSEEEEPALLSGLVYTIGTVLLSLAVIIGLGFGSYLLIDLLISKLGS